VTSPPAGADQSLAERYGRPSPAGRRLGIAAIAVIVAGLLAWLVWAALAQSRSTIGGVVQSYDVRSPHQIVVTLQVSRGSGDAVTCTVTALASDHTEVGRRAVRDPAGQSGTRAFRVAVKTEREATTATVAGCH
jgi:hypothetical protein